GTQPAADASSNPARTARAACAALTRLARARTGRARRSLRRGRARALHVDREQRVDFLLERGLAPAQLLLQQDLLILARVHDRRRQEHHQAAAVLAVRLVLEELAEQRDLRQARH